jgi:hypothetical protein
MSALIEPGSNGLLASEHKDLRPCVVCGQPTKHRVGRRKSPTAGHGEHRAARTPPPAQRGATPSLRALGARFADRLSLARTDKLSALVCSPPAARDRPTRACARPPESPRRRPPTARPQPPNG